MGRRAGGSGGKGPIIWKNGQAFDLATGEPVAPEITAWAAYTPTFQGLGTVTSINFRWRTVLGSVEIQGKCTVGTVTGDEVQVLLPNSLTVATALGNTQLVGISQKADTNTSTGPTLVIATAGDTFLNMAFRNASLAGLTPQAGTDIFTNGQTFSMMAQIEYEPS